VGISGLLVCEDVDEVEVLESILMGVWRWMISLLKEGRLE
jgi:hypothetical protein